jgi:hypothetical protein
MKQDWPILQINKCNPRLIYVSEMGRGVTTIVMCCHTEGWDSVTVLHLYSGGPRLNPVGTPDILTVVFGVFAQCLQVNFGNIYQSRP